MIIKAHIAVYSYIQRFSNIGTLFSRFFYFYRKWYIWWDEKMTLRSICLNIVTLKPVKSFLYCIFLFRPLSWLVSVGCSCPACSKCAKLHNKLLWDFSTVVSSRYCYFCLRVSGRDIAKGSTLFAGKDKISDEAMDISAALRKKSFCWSRKICNKFSFAFSSKPDHIFKCSFTLINSTIMYVSFQ